MNGEVHRHTLASTTYTRAAATSCWDELESIQTWKEKAQHYLGPYLALKESVRLFVLSILVETKPLQKIKLILYLEI